MAETIKSAGKSFEALKAEQDKLRDELNDLRNKKGDPDAIKVLKAKLAQAVEATRAAKS